MCVLVAAWILPSGFSIAQAQTKEAATGAAVQAEAGMDPALARDWLRRWKQSILDESRKNRYCDTAMGEQIADVVSPFLNGFYYGYRATGDREWVDRLFDWAGSVLKRGVKEPDGFIGWPKEDGAETDSVKHQYTDNEMGDALFLRPMVLMAAEILKTPALKEKYGAKAEEYIKLSEQMFEEMGFARRLARDERGRPLGRPALRVRTGRPASGPRNTSKGRRKGSRCRITSRTSSPSG